MQGLGAEARLTRVTRRSFALDGPAPHGSGPFACCGRAPFSPGSAPRPETGAVGTGRRRRFDRTRQTGVPRVRMNRRRPGRLSHRRDAPQKETPPFGGVRSLLVRRRAGGPAALSLLGPVCCGFCPSTSLPSRWPCPPFPSLRLFRPCGRQVHSGCRLSLPWCGCVRSGRPGAQHPQSVAERDNLRAKSREVLYYQ